LAPQANIADITRYLDARDAVSVDGPRPGGSGGRYRVRVARGYLRKEELERLVKECQSSSNLMSRARPSDEGTRAARPDLSRAIGQELCSSLTGHAGNLMPPLRASSISRFPSNAFSPSVAVFKLMPAASYMRCMASACLAWRASLSLRIRRN